MHECEGMNLVHCSAGFNCTFLPSSCSGGSLSHGVPDCYRYMRDNWKWVTFKTGDLEWCWNLLIARGFMHSELSKKASFLNRFFRVDWTGSFHWGWGLLVSFGEHYDEAVGSVDLQNFCELFNKYPTPVNSFMPLPNPHKWDVPAFFTGSIKDVEVSRSHISVILCVLPWDLRSSRWCYLR
jgi:hypothetical protein